MPSPQELSDQAFMLLREALADSEARIAELEAELARGRDVEDLEQRLETAERRAAAAEGANRNLTERLTETQRKLSETEAEHDELRAQHAELERKLAEARAQIETLEQDLREEKEVSDNLSELANERRETLTKLQEKAEELEERHAEAEWRLGKARHFERLVRRRRGLIKNLISTIRVKTKANTALKAGLDGLRRYPATAETNRHKLLKRIDKLKAELEQARKKAAERAPEAGEPSAREALVARLEERLSAQVEIIESLEEELKVAKAGPRTAGEAATELAELRATLAAKDRVIDELQRDIEDQSRRLAQLRVTENETTRLQIMAEQDKGQIEALKREVASLRELLAATRSADGDRDGAEVGSLIDQLQQYEHSIAELVNALEEKNRRIATLVETADEWRRKYEQLSGGADGDFRPAAHE